MEMERIKKLVMIFLACTVGAVTIQLVLPMLLGMLVNGLPFVGAFVIYDVFIRRRLKLSFSESGEGAEASSVDANGQTSGQTNRDTAEESVRSHQDKKATIQKENGELKKTKGEAGEAQEAEKEEKRQKAAEWYESTGRKRIQGIVSNLYARGVYECWIRKDGICNIRTEKRYRRAGSLPGFSWDYADEVAELLCQEGLNAVRQKSFLYLAWAEE